MSFMGFTLLQPKGICRLNVLLSVPDSEDMYTGAARTGRFPADAHFEMNEDFPKDIKLADALGNKDTFLVVSERLADFLASAKALKNNELLEVGIVNHKGRREKAKYFIVHQIKRPSCVDKKKTVGTVSNIDRTQYQFVDELVLDESRIDPKVAILRAAEYPDVPLFRRDLAEQIEGAGFTGGISFLELDQFNEI